MRRGKFERWIIRLRRSTKSSLPQGNRKNANVVDD